MLKITDITIGTIRENRKFAEDLLRKCVCIRTEHPAYTKLVTLLDGQVDNFLNKYPSNAYSAKEYESVQQFWFIGMIQELDSLLLRNNLTVGLDTIVAALPKDKIEVVVNDVK